VCQYVHKQTAWMTTLQVPKKKKLPSEKTLQQEIVQTLSGVNVLEFNIKMLMQHLSQPRVGGGGAAPGPATPPPPPYKACLLPSTWPSTRKHSLQSLSLQSVPSLLSLHSCPFNLSLHSCPFGHAHAHLWSCPWLCRCHEVICPCSWSLSGHQPPCTTVVSVLPVMWHSCIAACVITRTVAEHERDERVGSKRAE